MLKSIWTENCDLVVMDLNESVATCCQAVSDSCHGATVSLPLVPGLIKHNYIQTTVNLLHNYRRSPHLNQSQIQDPTGHKLRQVRSDRFYI